MSTKFENVESQSLISSAKHVLSDFSAVITKLIGRSEPANLSSPYLDKEIMDATNRILDYLVDGRSDEILNLPRKDILAVFSFHVELLFYFCYNSSILKHEESHDNLVDFCSQILLKSYDLLADKADMKESYTVHLPPLESQSLAHDVKDNLGWDYSVADQTEQIKASEGDPLIPQKGNISDIYALPSSNNVVKLPPLKNAELATKLKSSYGWEYSVE